MVRVRLWPLYLPCARVQCLHSFPIRVHMQKHIYNKLLCPHFWGVCFACSGFPRHLSYPASSSSSSMSRYIHTRCFFNEIHAHKAGRQAEASCVHSATHRMQLVYCDLTTSQHHITKHDDDDNAWMLSTYFFLHIKTTTTIMLVHTMERERHFALHMYKRCCCWFLLVVRFVARRHTQACIYIHTHERIVHS